MRDFHGNESASAHTRAASVSEYAETGAIFMSEAATVLYEAARRKALDALALVEASLTDYQPYSLNARLANTDPVNLDLDKTSLHSPCDMRLLAERV